MDEEAPPPIRDDLAARIAERERDCLAEIQAVLARYGCELRARPTPIDMRGQIWGYQWGVFYERVTE